MKEITRIEGWVCGHYPEGARGAVRPDGRGILLHADGSWSGVDCYVPAAVFAWVIAPLLDREWARGRSSGVNTLAAVEPQGAPLCRKHRDCVRGAGHGGKCHDGS